VLRTAAPRNHDLGRYDDIWAKKCQVYYDERSVTTVREATITTDSQPSQNAPSIDSGTGTLSMDLTHLFMFTHKPRIIRQYGNVYLYEVVTQLDNGPPTGLRLCFFAWTVLQIEAGNHLFARPRDDAAEHNNLQAGDEATTSECANDLDKGGLMYLVLRTVLSKQGPFTYQLVTTRLALCASYPSVDEDFGVFAAYTQSDWIALRNLHSPRLSEIQTSVSSIMLSIMSLINTAINALVGAGELRFIVGMAASKKRRSWANVAAIVEGYYRDCKGDSYYGVNGGYLGYLLPNTGSRISSPKRPIGCNLRLPKPLKDFLTRTNCTVLLESLSNAFQPPLAIEEVCRMIRAGPTEAQRSTPIYKYINGVRVDGTVRRVLIV
jgi:hypothetical protein